MELEPPNADQPKRKRRWFQFSLRSLLIGVKLLAVVCGWQAKIIRDRREAAKTYQTVSALYETFGPNHTLRIRTRSAPWPLRWLGEDGYFDIIVPQSTRDNEVQRLESLFSEAGIEREGDRAKRAATQH
jgi:hypothetical protein